MKTSELYPTSAITHCFPWRSNAVIQDWLKKGLIRAHHDSAGPGDYYLFTSPQMVHVGVMDQLSMLGVLRDLDKRKDDVAFDRGDKSGTSFQPSSLKAPADAESYYEYNDFNVLITVGVRQNHEVSVGSGRTKRQHFFYQIRYRNWLWDPDKPQWDSMKDLELWASRLNYDPHPVGLIAVRPIWERVRQRLLIGYRS